MEKSRRNFVKKASLGAAALGLGTKKTTSAKSYSRIIGANDRIHVALQGLGRRYQGYIPPFSIEKNNIQLDYLCDVMQSQMDNASTYVNDKLGFRPKTEKDIRKILEDKRIDAVFMATPDHWHAYGACMAMQADKHVYLEKPCSHNPREGELLVSYQNKYNKVVQMGNQQRSSLESKEIIDQIHDGLIGKAYLGIAIYTNSRGEVPRQTKKAPPTGLDWELWQGPAPRRDYTDNTWDYNWHWYGWDYGTAEMGNNATHELDIARWALQVDYPSRVNVIADKYQFLDDGWEMYDTMEATYHFSDDRKIQWDGRSRNGYNKYGKSRGTLIYGSKGSVFIDRSGYTLFGLDGKKIRDNISTKAEGGIELGGGGDLTSRHMVNFFQTIRGIETLTAPIHDAAISQMMTHYANISYRVNKSLEIDENTGTIYDRDAMKLWSRTYEPGWEIKNI